MDWLIWTGAVISGVGLAGILWCIWTVARARRAKLDDEALRERLRGVIPVNMAALLLSVLGLMVVVVGIVLG